MSPLRSFAALLLSLTLFQTVVLGGAACRTSVERGSAVLAVADAGRAADHRGHPAEHRQHDRHPAPSEPTGVPHHASLPCAAASACTIVADAATVGEIEAPLPSAHAVVDARDDRLPARPARAPEPPPPRA